MFDFPACKTATIAIAATVAASMCACAPQATTPTIAPTTADEVNYEGLRQIRSRHFDLVFIRPGVDFTHYESVVVEEPELAFRTPDRSKHQFPLRKEQKMRFRDLLARQFGAELAGLGNLTLVDAAGPDVLKLHVHVQDVTATLPPRTVGNVGRAAIALEAVGEATLVIQLHDSESGEILARVVDQEAVEGVALAQRDGPITRWEDVEKLARHWAETVRARLDVLVSGDY